MNYISIGISGLFAALCVAFVVLLLAAISRNLRTADRFRSNMGNRLSSLRLSRMLSLHHIDREAYLHTQPVLDIEEQMKRCSNCAETQRCDQVLVEEIDTDTTFCDNDEELQKIKTEMGSAA